MHKKRIRLLIAALLMLILCPLSALADPFTVTLYDDPADTTDFSVTMGDATGLLHHRVTNNSGSKNIKIIRFAINNALYNFGPGTAAPSGWKKVEPLSPPCSINESCIEFSVEAGGGGIPPGGNLIFDLIVTGPRGGNILAAAQDITTDSLSGASVSSEGGFTLSGGLPTWTRRSLAILLGALPGTVGVGGTITLTMQVTNRTTAAKNNLVSVTEPPTPTYTGGALVSCGSPPTKDPDPLSLAPGATGTMTWSCSATNSGTVYFTAHARNDSNNGTSNDDKSDVVVIGNFTSILSMDQTVVVSGQDVTVSMTVANNGTSALGNVMPNAILLGGTASKTFVSGPTPVSLSSLAPGQSVNFQWVYTITGTAGQTYSFSGSAIADGSLTTNTSSTPTGTLSTYSVDISPDSWPSNTEPLTIQWTVYNRGGTTVKEVDITIPSPCISPCDTWGYNSTSGGANWTATPVGSPVSQVQFTANGVADQIPVGGSRTFSITFGSTPNVVSDTPYTFPVLIKDKNNKTSTINSSILITAYKIDLTHSPAGPISADGKTQYTITAKLTGPSPAGKTISFTATNGTLSSSTAVAVASGVATEATATVNLIAPTSCADTSADVTATYLGASDTDAGLGFSALTGANLSYYPGISGVPPTSGALTFNKTSPPPAGVDTSPISINTKDVGTFTLKVKNTGCASITIDLTDPTQSSLSFGTDILTLSDPTASFMLSADEVSGLLTFSLQTPPGRICSGGDPGGGSETYDVLLILNGTGYTGPFSSPDGDTIDDKVTVTGNACVRILDWREVR